MTADRSALAHRQLLGSSARDRLSSLVLVGTIWVMAAVSIAVDGPRQLPLLVVAVIGTGGLWVVWRPAVYVEDDQLVLRNLLYRRVLPREAVRGFRVARRSGRTVSVWAVTPRGAVAINAAERPRFMPQVRDLDADVAVLNTWLHRSDSQPPQSVSYLPDKRPK